MALEPRISPLPPLSLGDKPVPMQLSRGLEDLRGRLSVIYAGAFFHLFNEETQFAIALRLLLLLRRPFSSSPLDSAAPKKRRKAIIFGRHQSQAEAGMIPDWMGRERYAHSPSTLPGMWAKAFDYLEKNYGIEKPGEGRVQVRSFLTGHLHGIPGDVSCHSTVIACFMGFEEYCTKLSHSLLLIVCVHDRLERHSGI